MSSDLVSLYRQQQFFPTPYNLALAAIEHVVLPSRPMRIIDMGAGHGVWGKAFTEALQRSEDVGYQQEFTRRGCLDAVDSMEDGTEEQARARSHYHSWYGMTFNQFVDRHKETHMPDYSMAIGNPPYGSELMPAIIAGLRIAWTVVYLVPISVLASKARYETFFSKLHVFGIKHISTLNVVPRPSFVNNSSQKNTEYIILTLSRDYYEIPSGIGWLKWDRNDKNVSSCIVFR